MKKKKKRNISWSSQTIVLLLREVTAIKIGLQAVWMLKLTEPARQQVYPNNGQRGNSTSAEEVHNRKV